MIQLLQGDCLSVLATLDAGSVQTVITSPPYYGLRDYGTATWIGGDPECDHKPPVVPRTARPRGGLTGGLEYMESKDPIYRDTCGKCGAKRDDRQIGQEAAPDCLAWARREPPCSSCYVCALRAVFAAVWRVMRDDGTCWINLGDTMTANRSHQVPDSKHTDVGNNGGMRVPEGMKEKNLLLIPARVALVLQSDGWIVRCDICWEKPNAMPESVTDRPTRAHEYVYLLSKQARYYYDADAIREPHTTHFGPRRRSNVTDTPYGMHNATSAKTGMVSNEYHPAGRNKRSVWTIATRPYAGAHFATMPEALIEPCLLAGSSAQACQHCGAAWGRVVERETTGVYEARPDRGLPAGMMPQKSRAGDSTATTLGFAPRCQCALNTGAASSTVLDPFAGTGTVLRVAERFGRNAIGIELNPDYGELSDARTNGVQKELFV